MASFSLGIDLRAWHARVLLTNQTDDDDEPAVLDTVTELAAGEPPPFGFAPITDPWDDDEEEDE